MNPTNKNHGKKIRVKQIRSLSSRKPEVIKTVHALGLGRIGDSVEHTLSDSIRGMIKRVQHLVVLEYV